jgi:hypothetical protein
MKATTKHAKSCTLSVSPSIGGLPKTFDCSSGSLRDTVKIPKNAADNSRTYTFTLAAKSGSLVARAHITVKQEPALPKILAFTGDHRSVRPDHATDVIFKGAVAHAKTCRLSASLTVPGLPVTFACTNGGFVRTIKIPATRSASPRKFRIRLDALNATKRSTHKTLTVSQSGATPPGIAMSISPASIASSGGKFTVQGTVSSAKTCTLTSSPDLGSKSGDCSSGAFAKKFTLPANSSATNRSFSFTLKAVGPGGTAIATLTATEPPAQAPPVTVLSINSSPAAVPGTGTATFMVSATLSGASTCTWTEDSGTPTTPESCTTSASHDFGPIAANLGATPITHTFELDATNADGTGTASASLTVTQPPATVLAPTMNSITPSPTTLTSDGGTLTVSASVSGADTCTMTSSPDVGSLSSTDCSGGTTSHDFTIPANTTGSDITYTITVNATSAGGTATGTLTMIQPAAVPPAPKVVSMTYAPKKLDYHGGAVTITAHVTNASTCTMTSTPNVGSKPSTDCSGGTLSGTVTFPPNNTKSDAQYSVTVHAHGDGGKAEGTLTFFLPPKPAS